MAKSSSKKDSEHAAALGYEVRAIVAMLKADATFNPSLLQYAARIEAGEHLQVRTRSNRKTRPFAAAELELALRLATDMKGAAE
jgi:hypothetical protein